MFPKGKIITWLVLGTIGTLVGADLIIRYCEHKASSGLAIAMIASMAAYLLVTYANELERNWELSIFEWEAAKKVIVPLHLLILIPALGTAMGMGFLATFLFTALYLCAAVESLFGKKDIWG